MADQLKINTSNLAKYKEFSGLFSKLGIELSRTDIDLPEIDADPLSIVIHKASQLPINTLVDDTCLDIKKTAVNTNVRYEINNMETHVGRAADWTVLLAIRDETTVRVFQGLVSGQIVPNRGTGGFGFDSFFQPTGAKKTLAEEKPEHFNARALAVKAFCQGDILSCHQPMINWRGPWQGGLK